MAVTQLIGARIDRREDPRLITGHGAYVRDVKRPGMLHMVIVRSPYAHARFTSIDTSQAMRIPGVVAVYTAKQFHTVLSGGLPVTPSFAPEKKQIPEQFPIADNEATYQGEPVAVVLAHDRYRAHDAAQLVQVDYEPLPAVVDLDLAIRPGSPKASAKVVDNIGWDAKFSGGDVAGAFAEADVVVKHRLVQQRVIPAAMETRGVVADYVPFENRVTIWTATQVPHFVRLFVSAGLGMPESAVHVISHDVGGAFGSKIRPYPEEYLAPAASKLSGRPVKWMEERTENLQATTHGRGSIYDLEVAAKRDGTLLAMKVTQLLDIGSYHGVFGAFQVVAVLVCGGVYDWKALETRSIGVFTNKVATDPYRGAGRPEAAYLVERAVDLVAREIGMDPADVRRKNFIRKFPHTQNFGLVYDSGDYEKALDLALKKADFSGLRRRQAELRKKGRYMGIGLATYTEISGFGPSAPTAAATGGIALVESSMVRVHPSGSVTVTVGTHSHGQGHDTSFAQVVADTLGVPYQSVEIRHGDTDESPFGHGTYGSRSLAMGGMAAYKSCVKIVQKATKLAAHLFEADEADIVVDRGRYSVRGNPARSKTLIELALLAQGSGLPEGMEQGLEAVTYFDPPNFTWPFGAHVCVVEVDPETGRVEIQKYVAVDDCGNVINPTIVEGQIQGGIAQGIGQALFEGVVYDPDSGVMLTGTMLDCLVPTANEIPDVEMDRTITPSPTNDLGVKGVAEAGTIGAAPAVINAICDALEPFGIRHIDMPARPALIWKLIQESKR